MHHCSDHSVLSPAHGAVNRRVLKLRIFFSFSCLLCAKPKRGKSPRSHFFNFLHCLFVAKGELVDALKNSPPPEASTVILLLSLPTRSCEQYIYQKDFQALIR